MEAQRLESGQLGRHTRPSRDDDPIPVFDIETNLRLVPDFN